MAEAGPLKYLLLLRWRSQAVDQTWYSIAALAVNYLEMERKRERERKDKLKLIHDAPFFRKGRDCCELCNLKDLPDNKLAFYSFFFLYWDFSVENLRFQHVATHVDSAVSGLLQPIVNPQRRVMWPPATWSPGYNEPDKWPSWVMILVLFPNGISTRNGKSIANKCFFGGIQDKYRENMGIEW